MEVKGIVTIGLEHIHPHPDNPRKDLGDLTELAESIKKNGIMQNLTVIPKEGEPGEYITIIGHRRSAAAKLAGVTEAPCRGCRRHDRQRADVNDAGRKYAA